MGEWDVGRRKVITLMNSRTVVDKTVCIRIFRNRITGTMLDLY